MPPAKVVSRPSPVVEPWSLRLCGPSPDITVTTLSLGAKPRWTWYGAQGFSSSFSPKQKVNLAGLPWVDRSISPGLAPATLSSISPSARPIVALACQPWPKQFEPQLMLSSLRIGPLTMTIGAQECVVARVPCRLYSGSSTPRSAAVATGKYSGLQPAITALAASAWIAGTIWRGGTGAKGRLSP